VIKGWYSADHLHHPKNTQKLPLFGSVELQQMRRMIQGTEAEGSMTNCDTAKSKPTNICRFSHGVPWSWLRAQQTSVYCMVIACDISWSPAFIQLSSSSLSKITCEQRR